MGEKTCPDCKEAKPLDAEHWYRNSANSTVGGQGWQTYCKPCFNRRQSSWYQRNKQQHNQRVARNRRTVQLARWGPPDEPTHCSICGADAESPRNGAFKSASVQRPQKGLALDHDHVTGEPRGVLCGHCNRAIGLMDDDPELFAKAALYIQQYRGTAAA